MSGGDDLLAQDIAYIDATDDDETDEPTQQLLWEPPPPPAVGAQAALAAAAAAEEDYDSASGDLRNGSAHHQQQQQLPAASAAPRSIQLYKRRWLTLLLFCCYSLSSAYQWIHLNIVFDVVLAYYNESLPADPIQANMAIDWLSMIYMLAYVAFVLPATWQLHRWGLRVSAICGAALNFAGALLKCFAAAPDRFPLLFIGQTLCAIAQNFVLGLPAPLAATWFGEKEVSTATSFGVFGNQLGVAVGFVVPPLFVAQGEPEFMQRRLLAMYIGGAVATGLLLVLIAALFREAPPTPPTLGRAVLLARGGELGDLDDLDDLDGSGDGSGVGNGLVAQEEEATAPVEVSLVVAGGVGRKLSYADSLKQLVANPGFVLLTISYGLNTGTYYALSTLLNPIIVPEIKKAEQNTTLTTEIEKQVGWAGFTMVAAGIAGSVLAGQVLDKTKGYKATTLGIYILSCLSTVAFTATLPLARMWLVFVSMFLLGFFMTGYLPVGFEFAVEITHPVNEGLSSGILNASAQIMGIACTIIVRTVVDNFSTLAGNIIFCSLLLAGSIMTAIIKEDLRRQKANQGDDNKSAGKEFGSSEGKADQLLENFQPDTP